MADVRFLSTSQKKLNTIPITSGNLIFCKDERAIYLDTSDGQRTPYQQIITLESEAQRKALPLPLKGFYFISNTKVLWAYEDGWTQLTTTPREQIVFGNSLADFPIPGEENLLYVTTHNSYRWLDGEYIKVTGTGSPEWIII